MCIKNQLKFGSPGLSFCITILVAMFFLSSAFAIDISMSNDAGSISSTFDTGREDSVNVNTVLSQDALQNSISGSGNLNERHSVKNNAGYEASVGVNLTDADVYTYSYHLTPGDTQVAAEEALDVNNAKHIDAYAEANALGGGTSGSKISIEHGSLKGYLNRAGASDKLIYSHQKFSKAEGDSVQISSWGRDDTKATKVDLTDYFDLSGINRSNTKELNTLQTGHIDIDPEKGSFTSVTTSNYTFEIGPETMDASTRTSNYGTNYDLVAYATSEDKDHKIGAHGRLTYYVNASNPKAQKIQRGIDVAQDKDTIRVAPGRYLENLVLEKSLNIIGSGNNKTKVVGQEGKGSVVWIRNKDAHVRLKDLALTNDNSKKGGGIYNNGHLILDKCKIYLNHATKGGAIYNDGNLLIKSGEISSNNADQEGGGIWNQHNLIITGGDLKSNQAENGGGVYNDEKGILIHLGGNISSNTANDDGGGIYNKGILYLLAKDIPLNRFNASFSGGTISKRGL
jgi:hypothetical protein